MDCVGDVVVMCFIYVFGVNLFVGDIIEIGVFLVGFCVIDMIFDFDDLDINGMLIIVFDVGFMLGDFGVNDFVCICGVEFYVVFNVV